MVNFLLHHDQLWQISPKLWESFLNYLATATVSKRILLACTGPRPNKFHTGITTVKGVLRATILCYNFMETP